MSCDDGGRVCHAGATRLSQLLSLYKCINYGQTVQNAARSGRLEIFDLKLKKGLERHEMKVGNVGKHFF